METNRFETFFDAIIAIIITVLVLKIPQPLTPTLEAVLHLQPIYMAYLITFLILYNIWYSNHNLFYIIDNIDNRSLLFYGMMTFIISLLPYFTIWLANNVYSVAAETIFGLIFIITHILNTLAIRSVRRSNPYNEKLNEMNHHILNIPVIFLLLGFLITYTVYVPGIFYCCLISVLLWIILGRQNRPVTMKTERFEALIDAILAIIITIIVLEIPLASGGGWNSLYELRYEFIIYAVSFVVCFNFWNYNNNIFSLVNRVNNKVIWTMGINLFIFSLLPYLTTFIAENFYVFFPQLLYGLLFIAISVLSKITSVFLRQSDPGNIALQLVLGKNYNIITVTTVEVIGIIIGYLFYPPAITFCCLFSIVIIWIIPKLEHIFSR